jgi:hypothetical protein
LSVLVLHGSFAFRIPSSTATGLFGRSERSDDIKEVLALTIDESLEVADRPEQQIVSISTIPFFRFI